MRSRRVHGLSGVLFVIAFACVGDSSASQVTPAPDAPKAASFRELARRIADEVAARLFGKPRTEWRQLVPNASWREFRGEGGRPLDEESAYRWPAGMWCAIADDKSEAVSRQAVFYAIRPDEPLDCRLEQITYVVDTLGFRSGALTTELYGELTLALTSRFGDGATGTSAREPSPEPRFGSPREAVIAWGGGTFVVSLFIEGGRVGIVARHDVLTDALHATDGLSPWSDIAASFRERLLREVRREHAPIADLITDQRTVLELADVVPAAKTLLSALERETEAEERAWLALAAELVVLRLHLAGDSPPGERPGLSGLASFGLEFSYDGHDDNWVYQRGLSEAVIRRYPETTWGKMVIAEKILAGWRWSECEDSYAETAQHGEEWLKLNPSSRYRLAVMQAVAQAYETWWSLSKAPEYDEFASYSRQTAAPGAGRARADAITWYERLLQEVPVGVSTRNLERTLIHLKLGVDTGQRRFHCVVP